MLGMTRPDKDTNKSSTKAARLRTTEQKEIKTGIENRGVGDSNQVLLHFLNAGRE